MIDDWLIDSLPNSNWAITLQQIIDSSIFLSDVNANYCDASKRNSALVMVSDSVDGSLGARWAIITSSQSPSCYRPPNHDRNRSDPAEEILRFARSPIRPNSDHRMRISIKWHQTDADVPLNRKKQPPHRQQGSLLMTPWRQFESASTGSTADDRLSWHSRRQLMQLHGHNRHNRV